MIAPPRRLDDLAIIVKRRSLFYYLELIGEAGANAARSLLNNRGKHPSIRLESIWSILDEPALQMS